MFNSIFILIRFSFIFFFLFPLVLRLFDRQRRNLLPVFITTVGLSLGLGSYFLFLVYLFKGSLVNQTSSFLFFLLVFLLLFLIFRKEIFWLIRDQKKGIKTFLKGFKPKNILFFFFDGPVGMIRLTIVGLLLYAFLLSPFFPISQWDDLVRYAAWGNSIFSRGEIGSHITSYPILVPLLYTYGFLASGFRNDYLIKLVPLTFGLLTLALTYLLANEFFERRKYRGLLAVFFSLCFPPFFDWLHLGYVDITSSFYFVGTFYFFYLYVKGRDHFSFKEKKKNLIFLGLFLGLTLWAKQQTLLIFVSFFSASLLVYLNQKKEILDVKLSISLKEILASLILAASIFSPWYLRDFLLVGMPIQLPVLEAAPTVEALFPFIYNWKGAGFYASSFFQVSLFFILVYLFVPSGNGLLFKRKYLWIVGIVLMAFGLIPIALEEHPHFANTLILNRRISLFFGFFLFVYGFLFPQKVSFKLRGILTLILLWLLPFYFVWWLKYTTIFRYLLTVIPLFVLLFVFTFDKIFPILAEKLKFSKISCLILSLLMLGFVLPRFSDALTGVGLKYFFANRETKGLRIVDNSFVVGEYLDHLGLPGRPQVISTDNRLAYFAPGMDYHNITPGYLSDLLNFDYYILNPWTKEAYDLRRKGEQEVYFNLIAENPAVFEKIYEDTPYKVYKIVLSDSDFIIPKLKVEEIKEEIKKMEAEKIENVSGAATPAIIPGNWRYPLKRIKDKVTLFQGQVFYNQPQVTTFIASKRLLEAYEVCLYKQRCDLAVEPLMRFRELLDEMKIKTLSPKRFFTDESFYLSSEMEKNFIPWAIILWQMSQKDSPISTLARETLEKELDPLIEEFYNKSYRLEPRFSYYNKNGELIPAKIK